MYIAVHNHLPKAFDVIRSVLWCGCLVAVFSNSCVFPAIAGENIIWNGDGQEGTNTSLQTEPFDDSGTQQSIFPSQSSHSNNIVKVNAPIPNGSAYGAVAIVTSGAGDLLAERNQVVVKDASITSAVAGYTLVDSGLAATNYNSVMLDDAEATDVIAGGLSLTVSGHALALYNMVTIQGDSTAGTVYGAFVHVQNANSTNGKSEVNYNTVIVKDNSVINSGIVGGFSGVAKTSTANNNSVTIEGGTLYTAIYGGAAGGIDADSLVTANNNKVTITGSPTFGSDLIIMGGANIDPSQGGDFYTGNTLNIWNYTGKTSAGNVSNFDNYNFILPSTLRNGDTLLTVDSIVFGNGTNKDSKITGIDIAGGGDALAVDDRVILIHANTSMTGKISNNGQVITGKKGVTLLYNFFIDQNGNDLSAVVQKKADIDDGNNSGSGNGSGGSGQGTGGSDGGTGQASLNPQVKALSEGRVAALSFLNQGSDLVVRKAFIAASRQNEGLTTFVLGEGGKSRYKTGSHADVEGYSMVAGVANNIDSAYGRLVVGAFFESGWGNYNSHNNFSTMPSVRGDGDTQYQGGGVMARIDMTDMPNGHFYGEGSLRAGRIKTDFQSSDLFNANGIIAEYDSRSTYYSAHIGVGRIWALNEQSILDIYGKYLWAHLDGDSVNVAGDPIDFHAADSHRLRIGTRYSRITTIAGYDLAPYIGAAAEYEFDGKTKATSRAAGLSLAIDAPQLRGATGLGEIGVSFKPTQHSNLSIDAGVNAYVGQRQGASGSLSLKVKF